MNIVGIGPGKSGGLAFYAHNGSVSATVMPIAGKAYDGLAILEYITDADLVVIEKVGAMPGQGVTSMFNFGAGYGLLQGICLGVGIPYELVTPQRWKKVVLADTKKDKNAAISYCRRRFPGVSLLASERCKKPHDGIADALCLMEYGRRVFGGGEVLAA